jgi:hypothetical protein
MLTTEIRMPLALYDEILKDLKRPHPFAEERVGFVFGRFSEGEPTLVLLNRYQVVDDDRYLESEEYGALIDSTSILGAMQHLRDRRGSLECALHVHQHFHHGVPRLSLPDKHSLPKLIPGFQRMCPDGTHGILVLSINSAAGWLWLPGQTEAVSADTIVVSGRRTQIFRMEET